MKFQWIYKCCYILLFCILIYHGSHILFKDILPTIFPFLCAFFISLCLAKPIHIFQNITHLPKTISIIIILILFYTILITPIICICLYIFTHFQQIISYISILLSQMQFLLNDHTTILSNFQNIFIDLIQHLSSSLISLLQSLISFIPNSLTIIMMHIISTFIFSSKLDTYKKLFYKICPKTFIFYTSQSLQSIQTTIISMIISNIKLIIITFVQLYVSLMCFNIQPAFSLSLYLCIFDLLPIVGASSAIFPWALYLYLIGSQRKAIALCIIATLLFIVRNIIEPKIMSKQLSIPPIIMLISLYCGGKLFSFFGFLFFPCMILFLYQTLHYYIKHKK